MRRFREALGLPPGAAVSRPQPPPIPRRPASIVHAPQTVPPPVPIEKIENPHLPQLEVPEVPEFHTVSSEVTAIPFEHASITSGDVTSTPDTVAAAKVKELLQSAGGLKSAFLIREIFNAPRGLQSLDFPHTFPTS